MIIPKHNALFITNLDITPIKSTYSKTIFNVNEPLVYYSQLIDKIIKVPTNTQTDLASLPAVLRVVFNPVGSEAPAAVIHDLLYGLSETDRKVSDKIFLEAMSASGVNIIKKWMYYQAVRLFVGMYKKVS